MSNLGLARSGGVALIESPLDDHDAHAVSRILRALGDPVRLRLLSLIGAAGDGEACVYDLARQFHLSQPAISHHLRVLREAGLITCQRRQTWVFYRFVPGALDRVSHLFARRTQPH